MSTTATTPCRVPPPGDAGTEPVRRHHAATPAQRAAEARTLGEMVLLDHLRGNLHLAALCRLCGAVA
jgi:hypothetical protein